MARKTGLQSELVQCPSCGVSWRFVAEGPGRLCRCGSYLALRDMGAGVRLVHRVRRGLWVSYYRAERAV